MTSRITDIDTALISAVTFQFPNRRVGGGSFGFNIKFQFPPKIVSDGRKGDWVEAQLRGDEPVAVYATSGAREITMRWTYIAGAMGGFPSKVFSPFIVSRQVSAMRSYFSNAYHERINIAEALVIKFRMWFHGGQEIMTCRMKSVDITHSTTLITDYTEDKMGSTERGYVPSRGSISPRRTYPLRTDVTAEMRLWTRVGSSDLDEAATHENPKLDLEALKPKIPIEWQ